ncbi:MAG: efflux RND transporter periplasmic adaptor subunit [Nitrospira sp.]
MASDVRIVRGFAFTLLVPVLCMAFIGCRQEASSTPEGPVAEVRVVEVVQQDVPIYSEWVGTTDGLVNATIQAQVTGYLMKRAFREGAFVQKGDLLFEIDPRPFRATLAEAKGQLGQAQAQYVKAAQDVKRDTPLAKAKAISQRELDDSTQALAGAKAAVASAKAARERAELNLSYTKIEAPIDGIVGIAKAQVGDLVGPGTGALASISTVDPIRVYFPVSEQEYLKAAEKVQEAYRNPDKPREDTLELFLSDGAVYPHKGAFLLADRQVDVKTGTILIGALFPNPGNVLRPGLFARVRAVTKTRKDALLIPQRAVAELQGNYQAAVVNPDNKVEIRQIKVGERIGSQWVIDQGLKPGERIVVEGLQNVKAGMPVTPTPFEASVSQPSPDHP